MFYILKKFLKELRIKYRLFFNLYPMKYSDTSIFLETFNIVKNFNSTEKSIKVSIGENTKIGAQIFLDSIEGNVKIGNNCAIGSNSKFISAIGIEVGNDVIIAWDCYIYDHNSHAIYWEQRCNDVKYSINGYKKVWDNVKRQKIKIEDKVWIGFGCVILKGVTIGEGAVVGARSVVTKDVEPWTVVAGNPARVVQKIIKEDIHANRYFNIS